MGGSSGSALAAWARRSSVAAALAVAGASSPAFAQPVTLEQARALAATHAPELAVVAAQLDAARADVQSAGALVNPTLTFLTAQRSARLAATISQPLAIFGQRGTAVRAAEADRVRAERETALVAHDARFAATTTWLDLWEAQTRTELLEVAAKDAQRVAEISTERFAAGAVARLDVVRATGDAARARAEASSAAALVPAAAARLSYFVGAPGRGELRAAGEPALPSGRAGDGELRDHPLLARDAAAVAAAAAHVTAERRQRAPLVAGELTFNYNDPTLPGNEVIGGLAFEAPVLNLRGGPIARARAEQALAQTTLALDAARLASDRGDAAGRLRAFTGRVAALRATVLPALEEARAMTEESYRSGRSDLLRLLEAQRAVLEGRVALLEATAGAAHALADWEHAGGAPLEGAR